MNIHFRFYDHVFASKHKRYESKTAQNRLIISSPKSYKNLIKAYVNEYLKTKRPTLMIVPQSLKALSGDAPTAAVVAGELEAELYKNGCYNVVNMGSHVHNGKYELISEDTAEYIKRSKKITSGTNKVDIVIAIKVMDEGVNWVGCEAVFMPRVPKSIPLIVQRIGRATRKKYDGGKNISNIYFFELGVKYGSNPKLATSVVETEIRLECLFNGLEFKEPYSFGIRNNQLRDKLRSLNESLLYSIMQKIAHKAMSYHGQKSLYNLIKFTIKILGDASLDINEFEALRLCRPYIGKNAQFDKSVSSFVAKSSDFQEFCSRPAIKAIIDNYVIDRVTSFTGILSDIDGRKFGYIIRSSNFYSFEEACLKVRYLGIKSCVEYYQQSPKDKQLPGRPDYIYRDSGWRGWDYFFTGCEPVEFYSYPEARRTIRKLGIKLLDEYKRRYKEDPRLPSNPLRHYTECDGSWIKLIGKEPVEFYSYPEARKAIQKLGIKSVSEYRRRYKEDPRLPSVPLKQYNQECDSWTEFFTGKEPVAFYSYPEARKAIQKLGINSSIDYIKRYKEDPRLPSCVSHHYGSWEKLFTGKEPVEFYSYPEARKAIQKLGIKSVSEYKKRYKEDPRLPSTPGVYYVECQGSMIKLITGREPVEFYSYPEARKAIQKLGIQVYGQYRVRYKEDPRLPSNLEQHYNGKGWRGFKHFAGKI